MVQATISLLVQYHQKQQYPFPFCQTKNVFVNETFVLTKESGMQYGALEAREDPNE